MICALSWSHIGTICVLFYSKIMKKLKKVKPGKRVLIRSGMGSDFIAVVVSSTPFLIKLSSVSQRRASCLIARLLRVIKTVVKLQLPHRLIKK